MAASTEQRELELVEKVYFRILSVANNEEKLQNLLKVYLPPLLLKLGSEYGSVRNKVLLTNQLNPTPPNHHDQGTLTHTCSQVLEICRERLTTFIQAPGFVSLVLPLLTPTRI